MWFMMLKRRCEFWNYPLYCIWRNNENCSMWRWVEIDTRVYSCVLHKYKVVIVIAYVARHPEASSKIRLSVIYLYSCLVNTVKFYGVYSKAFKVFRGIWQTFFLLWIFLTFFRVGDYNVFNELRQRNRFLAIESLLVKFHHFIKPLSFF